MQDWHTVFSTSEREAQRRWGNPSVWDEARIERLVWGEIPPRFHGRLEAVPFFFLATSDRSGRCDCSFKGGGPGLVRILDAGTLEFPDFDGNNAFMSLGNILENPRVGLLFIDFADGARLRVNGRATIHDDPVRLARFPHAKRAVQVRVEQVVPNCAAHVPRLVPVAAGAENGS
ncbi:MAG: pyridoxamine 5'-phosphate oxidase family protein [Pseudomonadales bacterium]|jgi:predicted pyridoxine 5'-phosphate oxidase superfamily flavin-nucleotide-binding protein|nr:pyridoxamine 5'-phosphate oxidase family protein [Pseudomonadales bacterium]